MNSSRVIVALDYPAADMALALVEQLQPELCRLKVGKELFTSAGPGLVSSLIGRGYDVFLDLKYHDIPNTVARACSAAARLGVWMLNIHTSGGRDMLLAAREALAQVNKPPVLIGVTMLTSLSDADLNLLGIQVPVTEQVTRLARLAKESGLDGVVCSASEAAILRVDLGKEFVLVTPGIRPAGSADDDQKRIMTPAAAIAAGSNFLVVGRPITAAGDPLQALQDINQQVQSALAEN